MTPPTSSPTKSSLSALLAASPRDSLLSSTLGKKRMLSAQSSPSPAAGSSTPGNNLGFSGFQGSGDVGSSGGGRASSSALTSSLTGGLSAALHAQSLPQIAVPDESGSGTPLSPLSSTTPLSCTPSEAVPMPRRKFPKQQDDVAVSLESEDDEFDSAAVGLSVRDPNFMPPHLLLSMSLPNNGPDFGRSGFRPGSVMEGRGRKLCGMDAFRVRNDILRQTGFLEPLDKSATAAGDVGDA